MIRAAVASGGLLASLRRSCDEDNEDDACTAYSEENYESEDGCIVDDAHNLELIVLMMVIKL